MAERAARRAIALVPTLGEGYVSLGEALEAQGRHVESATAFERGIVLNPVYPTAYQWYAYSLLGAGEWDRGVQLMETAHRLDPLAHVITLSLAIAYDGADRLIEADSLYRQGLAQAPDAWYAWTYRISNVLARGDDDGGRIVLAALRNGREFIPGTASAWRAIEPVWGDSAALARLATTPLMDSLPSVGLPLVRWRLGPTAVVSALERYRAAGWRVGAGDEWAYLALLGPALRADPRVRLLLADLGFRPITLESTR